MKLDFIASQLRRTNRNLSILTVSALGLSIYLIMSGGINALEQMISEISEDASLMGIISSFFEHSGRVFLFIIGLIILRFGVVNSVKLTKQMFNIELHPIYKAVSLYGYFDEVAQYINDDLVKHGTKKYTSAYITEHWILQSTALKLNVLKIEDVVWAYQAVIKHKQVFVGPGLSVGPSEVAKTYSAVIHSRNPMVPEVRISTTHQLDLTEDIEGNAQEAKQKREYVLNILEELEQKHPRAIYGYTSDLEEMWSSDRASFIKSAGFGA